MPWSRRGPRRGSPQAFSHSARARTVAAEVALEVPFRLVGLHAIEREQAGDRQILQVIDERQPKVVALDAPLSLPHSVTCGVRDCPRCIPGDAHYLTRDVDTLAEGMSTSRLAAIAFGGISIARVLRG